MNTAQLQKKEGFTIIEVVLVLAIAALIMLLVFLAWPALQRGQRDQGRKNDIGLIGSAIGTYKTNAKGKFPTTATERAAALNGVELSQYDASSIQWRNDHNTPASDLGQIVIHKGAKCDGNIPQQGSPRGGAVSIMVEANGNPQPYCQDI